jgi:hypothetical protein
MTPRHEPLVDLGAARRLQRPGGDMGERWVYTRW